MSLSRFHVHLFCKSLFDLKLYLVKIMLQNLTFPSIFVSLTGHSSLTTPFFIKSHYLLHPLATGCKRQFRQTRNLVCEAKNVGVLPTSIKIVILINMTYFLFLFSIIKSSCQTKHELFKEVKGLMRILLV